MIVFIALIGALFNRIRGGFLLPSQGGAVNVVAFGILAGALLQSPAAAIAAAVGMLAGQQLGWGRYIGALGGWETQPLTEVKAIDVLIVSLKKKKRLWGFAGLTLRGMLWGFLIFAPLYPFTGLWFILPCLLAGSLMGAVYLATISACFALKTKNPAGDGWEWGEAAFGAVFWALTLGQILKGAALW